MHIIPQDKMFIAMETALFQLSPLPPRKDISIVASGDKKPHLSSINREGIVQIAWSGFLLRPDFLT